MGEENFPPARERLSPDCVAPRAPSRTRPLPAPGARSTASADTSLDPLAPLAETQRAIPGGKNFFRTRARAVVARLRRPTSIQPDETTASTWGTLYRVRRHQSRPPSPTSGDAASDLPVREVLPPFLPLIAQPPGTIRTREYFHHLGLIFPRPWIPISST